MCYCPAFQSSCTMYNIFLWLSCRVWYCILLPFRTTVYSAVKNGSEQAVQRFGRCCRPGRCLCPPKGVTAPRPPPLPPGSLWGIKNGHEVGRYVCGLPCYRRQRPGRYCVRYSGRRLRRYRRGLIHGPARRPCWCRRSLGCARKLSSHRQQCRRLERRPG